MVFLRGSESVQVFHCFYMYCRWSYQEGRIGIPLTSLTLPHCCVCPWSGPGFPTSFQNAHVRGDCLFSWYWWNWWPSLYRLYFHFDTLICALWSNCVYLVRPTQPLDTPGRLQLFYPQWIPSDLFLIPCVPCMGLDLGCITERCIIDR